jgi:hypothetical protein
MQNIPIDSSKKVVVPPEIKKNIEYAPKNQLLQIDLPSVSPTRSSKIPPPPPPLPSPPLDYYEPLFSEETDDTFGSYVETHKPFSPNKNPDPFGIAVPRSIPLEKKKQIAELIKIESDRKTELELQKEMLQFEKFENQSPLFKDNITKQQKQINKEQKLINENIRSLKKELKDPLLYKSPTKDPLGGMTPRSTPLKKRGVTPKGNKSI